MTRLSREELEEIRKENERLSHIQATHWAVMVIPALLGHVAELESDLSAKSAEVERLEGAIRRYRSEWILLVPDLKTRDARRRELWEALGDPPGESNGGAA
jgi:hypothetical protein